MMEKLFENWVLKLISLAFAIVLWFFVMGERRLEVGHIIPLEYQNLPQGLIIANEVPSSVAVRISGPRALLMNLNPGDIDVAVDLRGLEAGVTSFRRLEENLNLPSGLKTTRVSPSFVDVKLERVREKQVPVTLVLVGEPEPGYRVAGTSTKPAKVMVSGAESELKSIAEVETEGLSLTGVKESFVQSVALNHNGIYTELKEVKTVEVQVKLEVDPDNPPVVEQPEVLERDLQER